MYRISLGNETFEGTNNAYLLTGSRTVLVDTGIATAEIREQLTDGLATYDLDFADVDAVFLTHYHSDHAGLAGEIQAAGGATVYAHEADAPLVEDDAAARREVAELKRRKFETWGIPEAKQAELLEAREERSDTNGDPVDVEPFEDGDVFAFDEYELEVLHTPGHTAGLSCFAYRGESLFAGDALLPKYTPNVGGADVRVEAPLRSYLDSLDRIVEGDYEVVWPGHRDPIDDPNERARTIRRHHEERARNVLAVLEDVGPADPWAVSAELFGELSSIHILHGPGEAYAHLQHLDASGDVERDGDEYVITAEASEALTELEDGRWAL